ncbi:MAG: chorismate synthase [Actinomycetota bacterium]|nr:chorismate synthase [Actinomycetota bacterium]
MRFLTAGESHGRGIISIIDGYPSGVDIDADFLNGELSRRQKGFGRGGRMSIEKDTVEIVSGIRKGKSTGAPVSFIIRNRDWENWKDIMDIGPESGESEKDSGNKLLNPRPGHADLNGYLKYGLNDVRDVIERSSARETAARVAAGGFAKIILKLLCIDIFSYVEQIGSVALESEVRADNKNSGNAELLKEIELSEVRCPDKKVSLKMKEEIKKTMGSGDSIGGKFRVIATGVPAGLGSYSQWDRRIDGEIARMFMSIPAAKAVEIGDGFNAPLMTGINFHDKIYYKKGKGFYRKTNRAGGIEGGITNGEPVIVGACMKPIPTTSKGSDSVNIKTKESVISLKERSDVCVVPAAAVIGESMLAITLVNAVQDKFGGDSIEEILNNYDNYKKHIENI